MLITINLQHLYSILTKNKEKFVWKKRTVLYNRKNDSFSCSLIKKMLPLQMTESIENGKTLIELMSDEEIKKLFFDSPINNIQQQEAII